MEKQKGTDFIIIDDDFINNVICQQVIQHEVLGAKIDIYINANKGLEYVTAACRVPGANNTILFLDINMPAVNGWDILEKLNESADQLRDRLKIFMLSSSVTPEDKQKANDEPLVYGYIEKPLTQVKLNAILDNAQSPSAITAI
jgi:CheY-like chemotaxis protein